MLSDGNILVRSLRMDDAQKLYEAARESIAEISPWLPWCHENYAVEETRQAAHYVTELKGGRGAVREVTDLILKAQGRWQELMERFS